MIYIKMNKMEWTFIFIVRKYEVTLEVHTNIPAFSWEFWAWSLGFMLVKQVPGCHFSVKTKIISNVVGTEQKNHGFFNQKIFINLEIVSFFYECKCVKIYYLLWKKKKTVVTSHRCLGLTTDKQIFCRVLPL